MAKRGVDSFSMIDTDSALYGRRLVLQIQKHSPDAVFVNTPIGRYQVYYAEFVGDSIQIRTACKRTLHLEPDEWAGAFTDKRGREISADRRMQREGGGAANGRPAIS